VLMISLSDWRRERIFAYLNPWDERYTLGKAYQLSHSLIAFGRGEIFGQGLGSSVEKLHYLPEAHTDFLLAVIGEELGFVGVACVIVAFFWLARRLFHIGRQAIALDRVFAGLFAQGVGDMVAAFRWTTPADGELPTPRARLAVIADHDETPDSYGVELMVSNLAETPDSAAAEITVTAGNGRSLTFDATRARGNCWPDGTVSFDGPDESGLAAAALGGFPFHYAVTLTLDGKTYRSSADYPADEIHGYEPSVALRFSPALPALQ